MTELRKASEVADFNLDGIPALKLREGESTHDFASRLMDALYGQNDLPRSHRVPTQSCACNLCKAWRAGQSGTQLIAKERSK
jgi:hypothetical protein